MSSFNTCEKSKGFSRSGTYFFNKIQNGRQDYVEVVIPELLNIYFNVIPYFHMLFNAELIFEVISNV